MDGESQGVLQATVSSTHALYYYPSLFFPSIISLHERESDGKI